MAFLRATAMLFKRAGSKRKPLSTTVGCPKPCILVLSHLPASLLVVPVNRRTPISQYGLGIRIVLNCRQLMPQRESVLKLEPVPGFESSKMRATPTAKEVEFQYSWILAYEC